MINYQFVTWMLSRPIETDPVTMNFNKFLPSQHSQVLICTTFV